MIKIVLSLLFLNVNLISLSTGCSIPKNRPIEEALTENLKAPWLVLVVDESSSRQIAGIGYGSLIAEDKVLTSSEVLANRDISNLRIDVDCKPMDEFHKIGKTCVSRKVTGKILDNADIKNKDGDDGPIVLQLSEPFELNERVQTIKLLSDKYIDDYDPSNCFTYHYYMEHYDEDDEAGLIVEEYRASLANDETFGINKDDEFNKLPYDLDCIALPCPYFKSPASQEPSNLSFLGSPVVCPLKSDPDQFIQAGYATNIYHFTLIELAADEKKHEHVKGDLVDFAPLEKEFHEATNHAFDN